MTKVLVLQHVAIEDLGTIADALTRAGIGYDYLRAFAGQAVPQELGAYRGLIVMGGPMGVYEADRYPWLDDERRLIERAMKAGAPVLGVCLGSQLIASVLGADVRPGGLKEIGWHPLRLTGQAAEDPLFSHAPTDFMGFHWHGDVFDLPSGAVQLASSPMTANQGFRYGEHTWATLFHLEVTEAGVHRMVETFSDELHGAGLRDAQILEPLPRYLSPLRKIGVTVYDAWAALVPQG